VVLGPHASAVRRLSVLTFGRPLVGVTVCSDTPVYSQRIVSRAATTRRRRGHALGPGNGVVSPRTGYRLTLPASGPMVDLFNPGIVPARVRLIVGLRRVGGGKSIQTIGTTVVTLKAPHVLNVQYKKEEGLMGKRLTIA